MSIRAKLLLPIMAVVVAVLVTSHFIAFAALKDNLVVERFRSEQRALDLVALAIVPDVLGGDLGKIHETLNEVRQRHTWWKSVTLTGRSGNRLYPLQAEPPLADLAGLTSEIASPSGTVGRLAIAFDMNALVETALVVLWRLEGVMTAILVLGGIIVVALQNRWFVAPLLRLSEASRLLSEGRYDAPLPPPSSDEVGGLIRSFDSMREAVGLRERALRDGERRLQAVIDNSAEAVLSLSAAGQILSLNAAAEHMFRASAKSMIGWGIQTLIPATAFSIVPIQAVSGIELEAMREDGERFPVWLTASEARLDDETILVATVVDLTERKRTEQQLKDSEGRFRDLAVSASDWFWETDEDNRLTFVSDRIGEILGVKPSGVLGFTYFDFGLSDYDPAQAQAHAEDLDAHRPFRDLTFAVGPEGAKDGKVIRISGMPFFNEDGAFIGYRGVGADITREAEAERRARLAQQQLADAIESINDGIALFDSEDRLVLCNQEYRRVFWQLGDMLVPGTRFESIIRDERTQTLFDPGEMGLDEWTNQRLQRHTQASGEPFLIRMTDGRWISSREYRTNDGGVVGVRADITEMKLREQALETLKHRYQLILDSAGDGIVELSGDGQVGFANRVAADLLQIEPAEMIGRHFAQLVQASADDAAVITGACTNGVAERVNNAEFRRNADAMAIPVEFLAAPIIENDVANGGVLVFRDISLRKHYEQVLADQHSELERLVAVRTTALSQEIKNRTAIETALRGSRQHLKGITRWRWPLPARHF
ncbi:MAG: PAS domain S-box protein [Magnetospirillum sp.]|nr:PAS domain S-box protein [Magnetospirillum sp.]